MSKNSIPQIRFQGFDSWWETIKLTDLGISVGGTAIESEFDPDGKYKVISIGSYSEESKYKDQGIRAIHSKKTERRILEKDDLTMILNDKTSTGKIIGRVLLIDEDNSYVYNQRTQRICLDKNKYVPDFIFQLLNADINRNKIVRSAQGNTQIYVNWSDISNLDYLIPDSFDEQSAIGSLFHTLDDLLASYKDNLANYQSLKTTMLSKMFPKTGHTVPEIRLDGFEGEWKEKEFSKLVKRVTQSSDSDSLPKVEFEDIISGQGKLNKDISTKFDNRKGIHFKPGYTLYGKLRPYLNNWLLPKFEGVALGDFWVFDPNGNDSNFIYYLVQSNRYQKVANDTSGTKMPRSDWKSVSTTIFAIPQTIAEQQAIGAYFSNLDNLINSYQDKISQLETLKKKLLKDMFI
ncbi:restriction endonuclease subunit S [Streptococcus oralis subsp. oralis]|uniref:restriction endonuclease subunit S n=1 Tax=Streptococcus oralis TaxID=1303 RepID=UPI0015E5EBBB|nr:restriction endonuclease subunit S [Streptococcus oralis]MBA1351766.1 restriction endonuclease subunit S [Streptococcus oralis subsp. oralis]